jgi:DNA-binding MarR family transcriptional regulator
MPAERTNAMDAELGRLSQSICNNSALRRAARRLGQLYDDALAPSGLKGTQFALLTQIRLQDGPRLNLLAADLVMDLSALGHTLKPLLRDGLVELRPDETDRRAKRVVLTQKGDAAFEAALALWTKAHGAFEDIVGPAASAQMRDGLDSIASPDFAVAFAQRLESQA